MRLVLALLLISTLVLPACGPNQSPTSSISPSGAFVNQNIPRTIGDPTADDAGVLYLETFQVVEKGVLATYRNGPRMAKILYTKEGTLVCDYPIGFIGPIPYGHAREDGTT